jgi:hypothetical protein
MSSGRTESSAIIWIPAEVAMPFTEVMCAKARSRSVTLHEKVDSMEEASLSPGVHDVQEEADTQTFYARVQS